VTDPANITVTRIRRICLMHPSIWEGETSDGQAIRVRFGAGELDLWVGKTMDQATQRPPIFSMGSGEVTNGYMRYDELKRHLGFIRLPENEESSHP
jgi:hypothetical protein